LRQSEPYSALLTAFWNFFDVLLAGSSSVLNYFAKKIKKAVGSDGRVLTNIIGNLDRIIGTQGNIDELIGKEAKNQFNYVFCNFIQSICSHHHPIVILLDDLQVINQLLTYFFLFIPISLFLNFYDKLLVGRYRLTQHVTDFV